MSSDLTAGEVEDLARFDIPREDFDYENGAEQDMERNPLRITRPFTRNYIFCKTTQKLKKGLHSKLNYHGNCLEMKSTPYHDERRLASVR